MLKTFKNISKNPTAANVENFRVAANAMAKQQMEQGNKAEFLSSTNARTAYEKLLRLVSSLANPASEQHNKVFNALKDIAGRNSKSITYLESMGKTVFDQVQSVTAKAVKQGYAPEKAVTVAYNAIAGNPVYDHFANLGLLASQLFEEQAFIDTFIEADDSFAIPLEATNTGTMKSRFRVPVEKLTGSPNIYSGDVNPRNNTIQNQNPIGLELTNEFKDAQTFREVLRITQDMQNDVLDFEIAANPALAGFILQSRFFETYQRFLLKLAEVYFIDGTADAVYDVSTGGSYGLLTASIILALADAADESPAPATAANWNANPTKLMQKISNFHYLPVDITAQLSSGADIDGVYKDVLRLLNLAAISNVKFSDEWTLYVPTSWFALANQFASTTVTGGTTVNVVTKTLMELLNNLNDGNGSIIKKLTVVPSGLLNAGTNSRSEAVKNRFVLISTGADVDKKPVILPGQTTVPVIIAGNVNAYESEFFANYITGGPMFLHFGGAYVMEYDQQAP